MPPPPAADLFSPGHRALPPPGGAAPREALVVVDSNASPSSSLPPAAPAPAALARATTAIAQPLRPRPFEGPAHAKEAAMSMNKKPEAKTQPTVVDKGRLRFLITDMPDERSMPAYIAFLKESGVVHLARACEASYSTKALESAGINVHDYYFEDGQIPPPVVIKQWLDLVEKSFIDPRSPDLLDDQKRIAVHCVAGFGRAPLLVAIALIEDGMGPLEAAQYVRERRRGALNTVQLRWLETYQRTRPRWASGFIGSKGSCLMM